MLKGTTKASEDNRIDSKKLLSDQILKPVQHVKLLCESHTWINDAKNCPVLTERIRYWCRLLFQYLSLNNLFLL